MKILSVNLPHNPNDNFGPIKMEGLGSTIVIAGANGSGKTRFLNTILKWKEIFRTESRITKRIQELDHELNIMRPTNQSVKLSYESERENCYSKLKFYLV